MNLIMNIKKYIGIDSARISSQLNKGGNTLTLIPLLFLSIGAVYATPTTLSCIRENGSGHIFAVEFDETRKTAKTVFGESYADIDKAKIVFNAITKEGVPYLFIIHRTNGRMELWNENTKAQLTPYTCSIANPKF